MYSSLRAWPASNLSVPLLFAVSLPLVNSVPWKMPVLLPVSVSVFTSTSPVVVLVTVTVSVSAAEALMFWSASVTCRPMVSPLW